MANPDLVATISWDGASKKLAEVIRQRDAAICWADILCEAMLEYNSDVYDGPESIAAEYRKWRGLEELKCD